MWVTGRSPTLVSHSHFTGKCNTLRHWSSLYPLPGQGLQVKANVANLFEMTTHSLRGAAMNLKATTLPYLAIEANLGLTQKEMGLILGVSHTTVGQALKKNQLYP